MLMVIPEVLFFVKVDELFEQSDTTFVVFFSQSCRLSDHNIYSQLPHGWSHAVFRKHGIHAYVPFPGQ